MLPLHVWIRSAVKALGLFKRTSCSLVNSERARVEKMYRHFHFFFASVLRGISSQTLTQTYIHRETSIRELTICRAVRVYLLRGNECRALMYEFLYICVYTEQGKEWRQTQCSGKWWSNHSGARKTWLWFPVWLVWLATRLDSDWREPSVKTSLSEWNNLN